MESSLRSPATPTPIKPPLPTLHTTRLSFSLPKPHAFLAGGFLAAPRRRRHLPLLRASSEEIVEEDGEELVRALTVPDSWMVPSNALQESEWLRATLHKWLDDEYCPEDANIEISRVAAKSYYDSLMAKKADLGEILLRMVKDLEKVSFQESFHGTFSSANAAVHLITTRMESVMEE